MHPAPHPSGPYRPHPYPVHPYPVHAHPARPSTRLRVHGIPIPLPARTNMLAVAALIWSLVLFMVPFGPLVMAPIALVRIRRHGERGLTCAVLALVLALVASAYWVVFWVQVAHGG